VSAIDSENKKKKKSGPKGPSIYRPEYHPVSFVELSQKGKCKAQIARDWQISRETIYEWERKYPEFSDAVKRGVEYCEAWYMDIGQAAMVNKAKDAEGRPIKVELGFYVWMTKNICKWSEKIEQKNEFQNTESVQVVVYKNGSETSEESE